MQKHWEWRCALWPFILFLPQGATLKPKRAKLNIDQAIVIKELHKAGWTQKSLAMRYGVRQQQVSRIIRGERWSNEIRKLENKATHKKLLDFIHKCSTIKTATER